MPARPMFPQVWHRRSPWKALASSVYLALCGLVAGDCAEPRPKGRVGWSETERAAERACQQGTLSACNALGKSLVATSRSQGDLERGIVLLETACGQEDLSACTVLGSLYGANPKLGKSLDRARDLLTWACQRRFAQACTALGEVVRAHRLANRREASDLFQTGCQLGDSRGCELYLLTRSIEDTNPHDARVLAALELACRDGRRLDCHLLALAQLRDPANRVAGAKLLAENCQHGFAMSCSHAAALFAPILAQNPQCNRALPLAEKACAANDGDGCAITHACRQASEPGPTPTFDRLALDCERGSPLSCLYWADAQSGRVDAADSGRVRGAYQVACRSDFVGAGVACLRIAAMDLTDALTAPAAEKALSFLREGCSRSFGEACCRLAQEYQSGKWVTADPARVAELRGKACALGQQACCTGKPRLAERHRCRFCSQQSP